VNENTFKKLKHYYLFVMIIRVHSGTVRNSKNGKEISELEKLVGVE
jgi:hypothetical protein